MMNELYQQVLERNARETTPFLSIHQANASLLIQIDALQSKREGLERDIVAQQQLLEEAGPNNGKTYLSQSAALKNETRLRDKLEKLQEELSDKLKIHSEEQAIALTTTKELAELKDLKISQAGTISELRQEDEKKEHTIEHLTTELADAKSRTKLAEQQYVGLKDSIRVLQEENDLIKKENRELETRFVSEKEQVSNEMNVLTEMVDRLKKEVDMLRALKVQEDKRTSWFGKAAIQKVVGSSPEKIEEVGDTSGRKWGSVDVILPSKPMHILQAHKKEASCVR
jgi:autophagy-related protein 16